MKELLLTQNQVAFVDNKDFKKCNQFNWQYNRKQNYVQRVENRKTIRLHRFILNITDSNILTDHRNRNGLDNTRKNIRIATRKQNQQNHSKRKNCISQYRGVTWDRTKWKAQIKVDGISYHLGYFDLEIAAAQTYDIAALQYFKEFASLNFPILED